MDQPVKYNDDWIRSTNEVELRARFERVANLVGLQDPMRGRFYDTCFRDRDNALLGLYTLSGGEDASHDHSGKTGVVDRYAGLDVRALCDIAYKGNVVKRTPHSNGHAFEMNVGDELVTFGISVRSDADAVDQLYRNALDELSNEELAGHKDTFYRAASAEFDRATLSGKVVVESTDSVKVVDSTSQPGEVVVVDKVVYTTADGGGLLEKLHTVNASVEGVKYYVGELGVGTDPLTVGEKVCVFAGSSPGGGTQKLQVCGVGPTYEAAFSTVVTWLSDRHGSGVGSELEDHVKSVCSGCGLVVEESGHGLECVKVFPVLHEPSAVSFFGYSTAMLDVAVMYHAAGGGQVFTGQRATMVRNAVTNAFVLAKFYRTLCEVGPVRKSDQWYVDRFGARYLWDQVFRVKYRLFVMMKWAMLYGDHTCMVGDWLTLVR